MPVVLHANLEILLTNTGKLDLNDVSLELLRYVDVRAEWAKKCAAVDRVPVGARRRVEGGTRAEEGLFQETKEQAEFVEE